ncbi:hypothetical protein SAMN04515671_2048 [Nakamurella panacisegetis]|uniref:Uncharacterized protein n=1 Tax=Nakamurella panacisegetis TaxID=1090615 RepID=A0A1H0MLE0_9ACTN|nr:hypothetical protein [Nakamurella panacisegetis]SDO81278.1 hypothetical protein SAMN04515671_2048 [Nakamurella panacisegetis]
MGKLIPAGRPSLRHRVLAFLEALSPFGDELPVGSARGDWRWLFADDAGVAVVGPPVRFTSADAAEKWIQHNAARLRRAGISGMTLLDGEHVVYGPTSLLRGRARDD